MEIVYNGTRYYAWQALEAMDISTEPFLNNIKSPTNSTNNELQKVLRNYQITNFEGQLLLVMALFSK
jgi:hypothetical protein